MAHTVTYQPDLQIIEVIFGGDIDFDELSATLRELVDTCLQHDCWLTLINFLDANFGLSITEIFAMPANYSQVGEPLGIDPNRMKRAFVVTEKDYREKFAFFEDVAVNRGHAVRIFLDLEEARAWLTTEEAHPA